jgi:chaperonin GroEL (HSP60 family)
VLLLSVKQVSNSAEVDEKLAALSTNVNAVRAIASSVEGTLGPKGLDTMLVDQSGGVVITNDGVTILHLMEAKHPAAKMLVNIARAQQEEIGDGTTTATIMAGALVEAGFQQVMQGVPVARIVEGIRTGVEEALAFIRDNSRRVEGIEDPLLFRAALIAGREREDIARLIMDAAPEIGESKLLDPDFQLAKIVESQLGAKSEVFHGLIINKGRLNPHMPRKISEAGVLIIDDALEPEEMGEEALNTEAGFRRFQELQWEFKQNLAKIPRLGVKLVLVDRGVSPLAEEFFTDAQIMVIQRVAYKELKKAAEYTGARMIKRTGLGKSPDELRQYLGWAGEVFEVERLQQVRILGGRGRPLATIVIGASTQEVADERKRIARDAASAVQAAVRGGLVPGGGSIELAAGCFLEKKRPELKGMAVYGLDCVREALKKPFCQITANSGFNPLEKLGDVLAAQAREGKTSLALNCDTGEVEDMWSRGVVDPALVKTYALQAAAEVAVAILRINTIIKMKETRVSE